MVEEMNVPLSTMRSGTELTRKPVTKMTSETKLYPRYAEHPLKEALADSPAVLIHGPRQCGKTTLARMMNSSQTVLWSGVGGIEWPGGTNIKWPGSNYITFDDETAREAAERDPIGFVNDLPGRVILDEVQRAPSIFTALKMAIDRDRIPGRFLLTGSSQVLLVPRVSDSLAGRLEIIRLHPLAQCELSGQHPTFLDRLFSGDLKAPELAGASDRLADRIVAGGFPAALARSTEGRRRNWYLNYVETQLQRDVRDIAKISDHGAMIRLLSVAATQTAWLYNLQDMSSTFSLSRPTIGKYVEILERIFLLERIPAWQNNRLKRMVKAPKLHVCDTGIGCAVIGASSEALKKDRDLFGQYLESFVFQELKRQASWSDDTLTFYHYRDKDKVEVDLVIEKGTMAVAGVEVKASSTVRASDFHGLRKLKDAAGDRFVAGMVLYDGEKCWSFGEGLTAVPVRLLWENPAETASNLQLDG